jgi:hypothetical protein
MTFTIQTVWSRTLVCAIPNNFAHCLPCLASCCCGCQAHRKYTMKGLSTSARSWVEEIEKSVDRTCATWCRWNLLFTSSSLFFDVLQDGGENEGRRSDAATGDDTRHAADSMTPSSVRQYFYSPPQSNDDSSRRLFETTTACSHATHCFNRDHCSLTPWA